MNQNNTKNPKKLDMRQYGAIMLYIIQLLYLNDRKYTSYFDGKIIGGNKSVHRFCIKRR